ncbi:MAG TPA: hypothetical protein VGC57_17025 [Cellulomonas sp.]
MRTRHLLRTPSVLVLAATAAFALAGCSGDAEPAPPTTATAPATATAPSAPATTAPAIATGCAPAGTGVPAGASTVSTIDLDGDGAGDTLWISGAGSDRQVGVTTASGATTSLPIDLAGPAGATAFALRPDPADPAEVLVTDNRLADLLVLDGCALAPVTDAAGAPWQFDLGYTGYGTGVGCVDVDRDGTLDLAGLNLLEDGATVTRTAIDVTGTLAAAGTEDQVTIDPADQTAVDTAHALTCGDRTAAADGVHEPQG